MLRYILHVITAVLAFMIGVGGVYNFRLLKRSNTPAEGQRVIQPAIGTVSPTLVDYEREVVELEGKLSIKTYFGPPNFGENPETDSKERSWILSLNKPINVTGKMDLDSGLSASAENVRKLQLVLLIPHGELIGKKVIARGTLFHAHAGHHHTDVLMDVQSITLAPSN